MINNILAFVLLLGFGFTAAFVWAFKTLPGEQWQVIAAYPYQKGPDGSWLGRNLTYYGLFVATAVVMGVATCAFLLGSMAMPASGLLLLVSLLLSVCVPASKLMARWIERKQAVLTIGGASFVGMALAPACIGVTNALLETFGHGSLPILPTLAALAIAYALGEGAGRLGCISFGCCYGKPLLSYQGILSGLFARFHFIFTGQTKKAAYEAGLEHQPVIPIQAVTAMIFVGSSLLGMYWFLSGSFHLAFVEVMVITPGMARALGIFEGRSSGTGRVYRLPMDGAHGGGVWPRSGISFVRPAHPAS